MSINADLPIKTCWIVTEGLVGLKNQAIGLAQALGVPYELKEIKKSKSLWRFLFQAGHDLTPPWPDMLIACGRQSVSAAVGVRRLSGSKTFTVYIQDPFVDPKNFDAVIVPAHDQLRGENVFVTQGAIHHVDQQKLTDAGGHFRSLRASLPRPLISVLIGGKNKHQDFSERSAQDFADKLLLGAKTTGGGLAISFSRRTGAANEKMIRQHLSGIPSYIWDGEGENPYLGLLSLADVILVTSDSISMVSEACSTGKPVYIYELPNGGKRHRQFCQGMVESGHARFYAGDIEIWKNTALDETGRAADFVRERYEAKMSELKLNIVH